MLNFDTLRVANSDRATRWHHGADTWTGADWSNAMCGEAGEAANIVKKIRRHETGIIGGPGMSPNPYNTPGLSELISDLGDELADVILYVDLLARHYHVDLGAAVVEKFNRVSEAQGFPERLG